MSNETDDTNYADIENIESVEGIIKIGISGAPSISDLSPNSNWKSFPPSSYNCCYGLPYQDHNYGAPPPPTPPPSPGSNALVTKNKSFEIALKSLKPNKSVPERRAKAPVKRQAVRRRNGNSKATVVKPVADECESVVVTANAEQENGVVLASGDYSDSITRCICSFTHDDGYMICCDQCQVWQHIDCMGIDRSNIPEEYCCEQCMPRKVHKARARLIQKKKRDDILRNSSEDENSTNQKKPTSLLKVVGKHRNSKKVVTPVKKSSGTVAGNKKKAAINTIVNSKRQGRRNVTDSILLSVDGDTDESPWHMSYESATANQYSTDIEESLKSYKPDACNPVVSVVEELQEPKCKLRLLANGHRGLEVECSVSVDQPLIEFKGKVMLQQQFEQENSFLKRPMPFVLFYRNWEHLSICVDATSFGNEARFVRRSCTPNAEVRHAVERGQVHLLLFALQEISAGTEVTIPFDFDVKSCEYEVECACVRAQCPAKKVSKNIKKQASNDGSIGNGKVNAAVPKQAPVKRAVHEKLKLDIPSAGGEEVQSAMGTKSQSNEKAAIAGSLKSPANEKSGVEEARRLSREDRKIEAYMKAFEKMEKREEKKKEQLQKVMEKKESPDVSQRSVEPVKKEIKQQVQPVAPKLRNQATKTAPTQAKCTPQQQPKSTPKPAAPRRKRNRSGPVLRRRTTSSTAISAPPSEGELDENSNQTSAGVSSRIPAPAEVGSTATGTLSSSDTSFRFPKTKKHLLNEWYNEKGLDKCSIEKPLTVSVSQNDSMDFVKTNSSPGSSWAHLRRNSATSNGQTTAVAQTNGTPVMASRKLDISMGSAKKRWLKQAMEEDSSNQTTVTPLMSPCSEQVSISPPSLSSTNTLTTNALTTNALTNAVTSNADTPLSPNGATPSASSHLSDLVTPLKKRRVARESLSLDSWPNSLNSVTAADGAHMKESPPSTPIDDVTKRSLLTFKEEFSAEQPPLLNNHLPQPLTTNVKLEDVPQVFSDATMNARGNMLLQRSDVMADSAPVTIHTFSTDMALPLPANDMPTIVGGGEDSTTSPLKKYKLFQDTHDNSGSDAVVMLSPREPRTLVDLMQPTSTTNDSAETSYMFPTASPIKQLVSPESTQAAALMSKPMSPCKPTVGDSTHSLTHTDVHSSLNDLSPAARAIHLGKELRRAVSMIEDGRHHPTIWNGADFGGKRVHDSFNQSPCGTSDFAPITPPSKKKVSLLEYRKRMQVQPPKSDSSTSASAPTTPLSSSGKLSAKLQAAPITLPALPLFVDDRDGVTSDDLKKPLLSLDERLKLEFGFAGGEFFEGDSKSKDRDTPPPPPPPLARASTNSVHSNSTIPVSSQRLACNEASMSEYHSTNELDERVASVFAKVDSNGYTGSQAAILLDDASASPRASPLQRLNGPSDSSAATLTKKTNLPLKQGSLGAVMLGHSMSSPLPNRDSSGSRQITQSDLPKKYR